MSSFYELRCELPARGYKPGPCHAILLRYSSTGGLEVKCHNCRSIQVIHKSELDSYQSERLEYLQ